MIIMGALGWVFYASEEPFYFDPEKCGKWMYFTSDAKFAEQLCREAVEQNIVKEAKHTDPMMKKPNLLCCFYLNIDDMQGHKKVIQFFLDHNLISRTKTGKLKKISFKLDRQTEKGEYGSDYVAKLDLSNFLDLTTGKWII